MIHDLLIILNLIILEGLLSVDNAAVLALMVKHLPERQRKKALNYGIWGAYIMRGASLFFISFLMSVYWIKILGGLYLLYLTYGHFSPKVTTLEEKGADGTEVKATDSGIYNWVLKTLGMSQFVATIILVEIMDLAFSIDNIFAAVALSNKMWVIITGVFIGIAAMRLVAMQFVSLMEKYPSLEKSAFIVIGLLGIKLVLSGVSNYFPGSLVHKALEWHPTDIIFSVLMMVIFFYPILGTKRSAT